jgi:integrase
MPKPRLGSIYQRKKRTADGKLVKLPVWWIQYCKDGRVCRESSKRDGRPGNLSDAADLLKRRIKEIGSGTFGGPRIDRIKVGELLDDLLLDYKMNNAKSYKDFAEPIVRLHLRPAFGHLRASRLTTTLVNAYRDQRLESEAAPATVNREMALLRRALNLGRRQTPPKVLVAPYIPMLTEDNIRTGFYEHDEFLALRAAIEEAVRPVLTFAYYTGCRRGEILSLRWPQVELHNRVVVLEPGTTKNGQGRILPLAEGGELYKVLAMQKAIRDQQCPDCPWVFFRVRNGAGEPIREFRAAWEAAAKAVGLVDETGEVNHLFHDFRRTGVRNLIRAGVQEAVAMRISGHKTRSVFDRYNIVSDRDLHDAARRLEGYVSRKTAETEEKTIASSTLLTHLDAETADRPNEANRKLLV